MTSSGEVLLACSPRGAGPVEWAALGALVHAVRRAAPSVDVRDPSVDGAAPEVSGSAVRVAVPLALTSGSDVALPAAQGDAPSLVAAALGPDWVLAELCARRLLTAGARKDDTIVLGVAGSREASVVEEYSRAARLVSAVWGGPVHVGSVGGGGVPLADALDVARAHGRRVVVSSYVLTPGHVADVLRRSGADVVTAPLLDGGTPDPRLLSLVLTRFHEALGVGAQAV